MAFSRLRLRPVESAFAYHGIVHARELHPLPFENCVNSSMVPVRMQARFLQKRKLQPIIKAMEIERKWLVRPEKIPYDLNRLPSEEIEQSYISFSPTIRIRRIDGGKSHYMTVKTHPVSTGSALAREEYEFPLPAEDYGNLLPLARGRTIHKTRYVHALPSGLKEEIDVFSGELQGLVFLEIEFPDVDAAAAYPDPDWIEKDVSGDGKYKNAVLAKDGMPQ